MPRLSGFTPQEQRQETRPTGYYQEPVYQAIGTENLPPKEDPIRTLMDLAKTIDYYTGAPVRSALQEYLQSSKRGDWLPEARAVKGFLKSFGRHPDKAPTGKGLAELMGISGKSLRDLAGQMGHDPEHYPRTSLADLAGLGIEMGAEVPLLGMAGMVGRPANTLADMGKRVYHGSPHKFEKFDISKTGTGEGAEVFGHGLYFTEGEDIARGYAENLSDEALRYTIPGIEKKINSKKEWIEAVKRVDKDNPHLSEDAINKTQKAIKKLETELESLKSGDHLYTARIPKGDYIDWMDDVGDDVLKKIQKQADKEGYGHVLDEYGLAFPDVGDTSGEKIYKFLVNESGSYEKASQFLNKAGVKGIEYPSGTLSGVKDSQFKNYVVFSDEGISIEDIKKLALIGAAGTGTGAVYKQQRGE